MRISEAIETFTNAENSDDLITQAYDTVISFMKPSKVSESSDSMSAACMTTAGEIATRESISFPDLLGLLDEKLNNEDEKVRMRATLLLAQLLGHSPSLLWPEYSEEYCHMHVKLNQGSSQYAHPHRSVVSQSQPNTRMSGTLESNKNLELFVNDNMARLSSLLHLLIIFFSRRLADYPSLVPSLTALRNIITTYRYILDMNDEKYMDKYELFQSIFKEIFLQSYSQSIRYQVLDIYLVLIQSVPSYHENAQSSLHSNRCEVLDGVLTSIENEKDPRCLILSLKILTAVMSHLFPLYVTISSHMSDKMDIEPDLRPSIKEYLPIQPTRYLIPTLNEDHVDILQRSVEMILTYFPITFSPPSNDPIGITREMIVAEYIQFIGSHPKVVLLALPYLLQHLFTGVDPMSYIDIEMALVKDITEISPLKPEETISSREQVLRILIHSLKKFYQTGIYSWTLNGQYTRTYIHVILDHIYQLSGLNTDESEQEYGSNDEYSEYINISQVNLWGHVSILITLVSEAMTQGGIRDGKYLDWGYVMLPYIQRILSRITLYPDHIYRIRGYQMLVAISSGTNPMLLKGLYDDIFPILVNDLELFSKQMVDRYVNIIPKKSPAIEMDYELCCSDGHTHDHDHGHSHGHSHTIALQSPLRGICIEMTTQFLKFLPRGIDFIHSSQMSIDGQESYPLSLSTARQLLSLLSQLIIPSIPHHADSNSVIYPLDVLNIVVIAVRCLIQLILSWPNIQGYRNLLPTNYIDVETDLLTEDELMRKDMIMIVRILDQIISFAIFGHKSLFCEKPIDAIEVTQDEDVVKTASIESIIFLMSSCHIDPSEPIDNEFVRNGRINTKSNADLMSFAGKYLISKLFHQCYDDFNQEEIRESVAMDSNEYIDINVNSNRTQMKKVSLMLLSRICRPNKDLTRSDETLQYICSNIVPFLHKLSIVNSLSSKSMDINIAAIKALALIYDPSDRGSKTIDQRTEEESLLMDIYRYQYDLMMKNTGNITSEGWNMLEMMLKWFVDKLILSRHEIQSNSRNKSNIIQYTITLGELIRHIMVYDRTNWSIATALDKYLKFLDEIIEAESRTKQQSLEMDNQDKTTYVEVVHSDQDAYESSYSLSVLMSKICLYLRLCCVSFLSKRDSMDLSTQVNSQEDYISRYIAKGWRYLTIISNESDISKGSFNSHGDMDDGLCGRYFAVIASKLISTDSRLHSIVSTAVQFLKEYNTKNPRPSILLLLWTTKALSMRKDVKVDASSGFEAKTLQEHVNQSIMQHILESNSSKQLIVYTLCEKFSILGESHPYVLSSLPGVQGNASFSHSHYNPFFRQVLWMRWFQRLSPYIDFKMHNDSSTSAPLALANNVLMVENDCCVVALCSLATLTPSTVIASSGHQKHLHHLTLRSFFLGYKNRIKESHEDKQDISTMNQSLDVGELLQGQSLASLETLMSQDINTFQYDVSSILPVLLQIALQDTKGKDRLLSLKCMSHITKLPYSLLHASRKQVVNILGKVVNDKKRTVRMFAAKVRNEWIVMNR